MAALWFKAVVWVARACLLTFNFMTCSKAHMQEVVQCLRSIDFTMSDLEMFLSQGPEAHRQKHNAPHPPL